MNLAELQRKLMATARANPPSERVPYAFEQRILAHLQAAPVPDAWAQWAHALWRAAASCVVIMLLLGGWHLFVSPSSTPADQASTTDLSQAFENTVLVAADQAQAPDSLQ